MDQKKPEEAESSTSRRQFLQRSPVVLLPYVAPAIASMAIYVKDADAAKRGRKRKKISRAMKSVSKSSMKSD